MHFPSEMEIIEKMLNYYQNLRDFQDMRRKNREKSYGVKGKNVHHKIPQEVNDLE